MRQLGAAGLVHRALWACSRGTRECGTSSWACDVWQGGAREALFTEQSSLSLPPPGSPVPAEALKSCKEAKCSVQALSQACLAGWHLQGLYWLRGSRLVMPEALGV